ncbi:MAG: helix-turn-helix domain-containing protein [Candidatus Micrarchaeota archaeon]
MREHLIQLLWQELGKEGFTAFVCPNSRGCFDVVARREFLLLIKVLQNIDAFTGTQADDLKNISSMLSAKAYLIGEQTKEFILDHGVMYERHGVPASNLQTFRDIIFEKRFPERRKFRRLSVCIDPQKLITRRNELKLSLECLSTRAGITKKTLYRYEHGSTLASEENLKRLENVLETNLKKGMDPFSKIHPGNTFDFHGFDAIETKSAPFQVLGKERKDDDKVLLGKEADRRIMLKRAETYRWISNIVESYSCFIVRSSAKDSIAGISIVRKDELQGLKKARELIKLIEERAE